MGLSARRLEDIMLFAEVAEQEGWDEGTRHGPLHDGRDVGRYQRVPASGRTIRAIKENPDLGISISTKRGRDPHTIVTFAGKKTSDEIIEVVRKISAAKAEENFKRTSEMQRPRSSPTGSRTSRW